MVQLSSSHLMKPIIKYNNRYIHAFNETYWWSTNISADVCTISSFKINKPFLTFCK